MGVKVPCWLSQGSTLPVSRTGDMYIHNANKLLKSIWRLALYGSSIFGVEVACRSSPTLILLTFSFHTLCTFDLIIYHTPRAPQSTQERGCLYWPIKKTRVKWRVSLGCSSCTVEGESALWGGRVFLNNQWLIHMSWNVWHGYKLCICGDIIMYYDGGLPDRCCIND